MTALYALLVVVTATAGILLARALHARGVPNYLSRKVAHVTGGVAYLLCVLFLPVWVAVGLSGAYALGMVAARIAVPSLLNGVGGEARHAYAEITYPLAGTAALAIGWGILGDRWLALVPILYLALGDSITGLVRSYFYHRETKGWLGSVGMLGVCLLVALLYPVYWIGAVGAVIATVAEKVSPIARGWVDDNWILVGASLGAMALLAR